MIERTGTNAFLFEGEVFNFLPWLRDSTMSCTVSMVIDPKECAPGRVNVEYAIVQDKEARRIASTPARAEALVLRKLAGAARALIARRHQLVLA